MLRYLLDTDTCVHALKRRNPALLGKLRDARAVTAIPDIALFELAFGAEGYVKLLERYELIESFCSQFEALPFDSAAALQSARIRHVLEQRGEKIGAYDTLIAGIAKSRGLILVTGNLGEFARIGGLVAEDWR
jgi:tRNA(fMet)-specific endonuclease VapC